jgi:hypothetical protein
VRPAKQRAVPADLAALMRAGDWQRALALAASFPPLGDERKAILDARTAATNPAFLRQLGRDPAALLEAGRSALLRRYPLTPSEGA